MTWGLTYFDQFILTEGNIVKALIRAFHLLLILKGYEYINLVFA